MKKVITNQVVRAFYFACLKLETLNGKGNTLPKKFRAYTDHESDGIWGRIYLKPIGVIARTKTTLSTDFRLYFLGLQRMSNNGHSHFAQGEISKLLEREGGISYDPRYINGQVSVLRNVGLLAPTSNARCLVYPIELISLKTNKKKVALCPEQGTHCSWSSLNNDWAPDYLPEPVAVVANQPIEEVIVPDDWEIDIETGTYKT